MLQIVQHIEPLLRNHNFVVIPALGGFVASEQPSRYENGMLYPPCKKVGFNPTLTYNDGLLAQAIAQQNSCTLSEANAQIEQEVKVLYQQLRLWKHVSLGNLGCLHQTENGIDFDPQADGIPLNTSYGLKPVYFPEITRNAVPQEQPNESPVAIKKALALPAKTSSRFAAACVAAILILLMIPVNFTRHEQESRAMFVAPPSFQEVVITPEPAAQAPVTCNHFHVVIGSFNTQAKAFKFISELPSSLADSKIIYSEHRFRIIAASYPTEELGFAGIEQIAQAYPVYKDAWLLHYNP